MSIKCLMNGLEVNYPCSPVCALFGDCVTAFEAQKKENVRTNADRIRAMSDEELAEFISNPCDCTVDPEEDGYRECGNKLCIKYLLEWLKQPAEGED